MGRVYCWSDHRTNRRYAMVRHDVPETYHRAGTERRTQVKDTQTLVYFNDEDEFEPTDRHGFRRRVVTGDHLQLCFWRIKAGSSGSVLHRHEHHEQLGIIMRGGLDFQIGDESCGRSVLGPGDSYLAHEGVWHGDSTFLGDDEVDECWILDVFSPPRDDLRERS
jgi:mannose-6-phosphate isomerase-like protein (cupin superfamily)